MDVVRHRSTDGSWHVLLGLVSEILVCRRCFLTKALVVAGNMFGQRPQAIAGASAEQLSASKLEAASEPLSLSNFQDVGI